MKARLLEQKAHKLQELISSMQPHRKCTKAPITQPYRFPQLCHLVYCAQAPLSLLPNQAEYHSPSTGSLRLPKSGDKGRPCNVVTFPAGLEWEVFLP